MKKTYQKKSDKFWKDSLMKILCALYYEEMVWGSDYWQEYGVSSSDKKKIEKEWARWQDKAERTNRQINKSVEEIQAIWTKSKQTKMFEDTK